MYARGRIKGKSTDGRSLLPDFGTLAYIGCFSKHSSAHRKRGGAGPDRAALSRGGVCCIWSHGRSTRGGGGGGGALTSQISFCALC